MSKRQTILAAINQAGVITLNELIDAVGGERKNLSDNLKACVTEDLVFRGKDDVTNLPCYTLTPKGRQWLKNPPVQHKFKSKTGAATQAVSGDVTTAASEPEPLVEGSGHAADIQLAADAVVEQPKPDDSPVAACSDVIVPPPPEYDPDIVCFDAKKREAAKDAEIENLRIIIGLMSEEHHKNANLINAVTAQRDAWREMAANYDCETPSDMAAFANELIGRAAVLEANAELPLENTPKPASTVKYGVIFGFSDGMADTPEEAVQISSKAIYGPDELNGALVAEVRVIGKVESRPVFVPNTH